jgi:hypothetical protein
MLMPSISARINFPHLFHVLSYLTNCYDNGCERRWWQCKTEYHSLNNRPCLMFHKILQFSIFNIKNFKLLQFISLPSSSFKWWWWIIMRLCISQPIKSRLSNTILKDSLIGQNWEHYVWVETRYTFTICVHKNNLLCSMILHKTH